MTSSKRKEKLLDPEEGGEEALEVDLKIRPRSLKDFTGQNELKERLKVVIGAAKKRQESVDHMLFAGPPGLGKTTLANIIAEEMQVSLHTTSGPAIERPGDLAAILSILNNGDVLFVDEIHRLSRHVEEVLYPAMEDFCLDIVVDRGGSARTVRIELPEFTLVAATTRTGLLTGPLRDRFGLVARLDYYSPDEMTEIVKRSAKIFGIEIGEDAAELVGRSSRGTPRISNRLLRRVRDYAEVHDKKVIDLTVAEDGLSLFGVDSLGLDRVDRAILETICYKFKGGPIGLSTLAAATGETTESIEEVYEPFLIQQGLLERTPRGRMATEEAWRHLGVDTPNDSLPL